MNKTIIATGFVACAAAACAAGGEESKRPNFLFIIADDQSPYDLKTYEPGSMLDTPNIDRLAREGMVLGSEAFGGVRLGFRFLNLN